MPMMNALGNQPPGNTGIVPPSMGGSPVPQTAPNALRPDPSQWRNLPGYGLLQHLQMLQQSNPDRFSQLMQSPMAAHFGITADNIGTMQSRQQARADAFGRTWNPHGFMGGGPGGPPPAQGLPTPVGQTPVVPQPPVAPNYQLPTY